ncbi:conserved hypothetical protein [Ixodes scapularis]|uniref:Uncharacterized protein n=1 Tax=Ixodes scapularis TaxID=6945 RepID=B7QDF9_IXOSC|nr:conserved hypothetical protein [Ixodes scapularis]|eukprot:XP_002413573.1 conserved hypothetical protein [Ixodes scapularis]
MTEYPGETGGQRPGAALPRPLSPLGPVGRRRPGSPGVAPSAEQTSVGPRAAPSDRPITRRGGAKRHEDRAHKKSLMGRAARVLHQCQRPCGGRRIPAKGTAAAESTHGRGPRFSGSSRRKGPESERGGPAHGGTARRPAPKSRLQLSSSN